MFGTKTLTTNDEDVALGVVDIGFAGVTVGLAAAASLDSGTVTIGRRRTNNSSGAIEDLGTLAAGEEKTYTTGAGQEIFATLSGANGSQDGVIVDWSVFK